MANSTPDVGEIWVVVYKGSMYVDDIRGFVSPIKQIVRVIDFHSKGHWTVIDCCLISKPQWLPPIEYTSYPHPSASRQLIAQLYFVRQLSPLELLAMASEDPDTVGQVLGYIVA